MPGTYGRITIGIWLLMYAEIGAALLRLEREREGGQSLPAKARSVQV